MPPEEKTIKADYVSSLHRSLIFGDRKSTLLDLFLGLSDIIAKINPSLPNHHLNVAYIAAKICSLLGCPSYVTRTVILASLIHDIGFVAMKSKDMDIYECDDKLTLGHCEIGYRMLSRPGNPKVIKKCAEVIRYHHFDLTSSTTGFVPYESFILRGADRLDVLTSEVDLPWERKDEIKEVLNKFFIPKEIRDAIELLISQMGFWFDLRLSNRAKVDFLRSVVSWPEFSLDERALYDIGRVLITIIDFRSPITFAHSTRVSHLARYLGEEFKLGFVRNMVLEIGGLLHDVGKLAVPLDILEKPGKLTSREYSIIQTHAYYTYIFLKDLGMYRDITNAASFHHERIDGSGYPFGLRGEDLTLEERIMAVSDVFSAMREYRPYKKSLSKKESISVLVEMANANKLCKEVVSVVKKRQKEIFDMFEAIKEELMEEVRLGSSELSEIKS